VLGGTAGIPHGVANAILLTRVMQFNLTACAAELALLAGPLGVRSVGRSDQSAAEAVIQQVEELVRGFDLPRRLREVGLSATDLPGLAAIGLENPTVATNPRPIRAAGELEELLRELW
jgi:1,3-propanediol dehydrogenase/alcohol dehydrogenase